MWTAGRLVPILLVAPIALFGCLRATASEPASCDNYLREKAPKFHLARQNQDNEFAILYISVASREITEEKLLTLSCSLGKTYARKQILVVWIFDNLRAAKHYNPQGEGNDAAMISALRASYGFGRKENDHSLTWWPDRRNRDKTVDVKLAPLPMPLP